ncbi:MAG: tRNA (adenosine(37)-N6)-dimethylallyltransferase MiaA [Aquisalinus sp.]|nr:tRNA (adenosine(37)-N6)-dimethylallyltransferase MiaA [Aquisalinus sp.]
MEISHQIPVILIAGPTASGKSSAALSLAEEIGGEIINADAMQVYRDLRVLTARPSEEDTELVPHHLYGTMDGAQKCSAGIWARQAARIIEQVRRKERYPIVTGGTGLYLKALVEGLSPIPEVSDTIREEAQGLYEKLGPDGFRERVIEADPPMAWLPATDRQRLVRAWEVYTATGTPLSELQALPRQPLIEGPVIPCLIAPEREQLYQRCDERFDMMLTSGALEEVQALLARQLSPDLPIMKSLGVPELAQYIAGEIDMEAAAELARRNTRRFAKRQMTWFNGQAGEWPRFATAKEAVAFLVESCSITG